jgi:hypothetical protein
MSVAQKTIGGFFRVMGGVVLFFAVLITVIVVGANHEEKQAAAERKAQAEARAKAQAAIDPVYGPAPERSPLTGEVYSLDQWLRHNVEGVAPFDWWGPKKATWEKDGEEVKGWQVSVAFSARNPDGTLYDSRWLFFMRGETIIDTRLVESYGYKSE